MLQSPVARRTIGAAYLVLTAFIIAHTTKSFLAAALDTPPEPPQGSGSAPELLNAADPTASKQGVEDILTSGLFELPPTFQLLKNGELVPAAAPAPPPPPIEAARKVAFLGSVHSADRGELAIVEDLASKAQEIYRVGMQIPNVGTLHSVERDRIQFKNGPSEEWLPLAALHHQTGDGGIIPASQPTQARAAPTRQVLDRREVTAALNDPTRLMTHAQAVPFLTDGKLDGFRLYNVRPAGFFDKIGLQTNDLVQRINGVEIRDPGMLLSLFQQLRNENTVRVDLVRNTQRQTLTYEIR